MPTRSKFPIALVLALYVPALMLLGGVAGVAQATSIHPSKFLRDPTVYAGVHPMVGVISSIGVLLWCATAAVCLFTWGVLHSQERAVQLRRYLLAAGALTVVLLVDDLFMFHDYIFPVHVGFTDKYVFVTYVLAAVLGMIVFRRVIATTQWGILILAGCCLGMSIAVDSAQVTLESWLGRWRIMFEDGFKFLGIVGWFAYFVATSFAAMSGRESELALDRAATTGGARRKGPGSIRRDAM